MADAERLSKGGKRIGATLRDGLVGLKSIDLTVLNNLWTALKTVALAGIGISWTALGALYYTLAKTRWTKAKIFGLALGFLFVVLIIAAAGCIISTAFSNTEMPSNIAAGKQVFEQNCVTCHGPRGDRIPMAPLNTKEFLETRGDATLITNVSEGKNSMPAWGKKRGGPLDDEQIRNVVAYLNYAAGRESSSTQAIAGQKLFASNCVSCHGDKGNRIPVAPLDTKGFLDSRSDDQLFSAISDGKGPMSGASKSKGGKLDDGQIKSIIAYLRYNVDLNVADSATHGHDIYLSNCLTCHGEMGNRVAGVSLASLDFLRLKGDGRLVTSISDGIGTMPGFGRGKGGAFDPTDIGAILAYLKAWAGTSASIALVGTGPGSGAEAIFTQNCVPCHGDTGDKVSSVHLRSKSYLAQEGDPVLIEKITAGNAKGMPSWGKSVGGPLSDDQIVALVSYLKATATDTTSGSSSPAAGQPSSGGADAQLIAKGKDIFTKNCVACHGDTRDKMPTAKLTDKSWMEQTGQTNLTQSIANGKGAMPAWSSAKGGPLSDDDIKAVVAFLFDAVGANPNASAGLSASGSSSSSGADPQLVAKGKDLFSKNCAACHGDTRDKMPTAKLADKSWVTQKGADGLTQSIASGKGAMPAWKGKLSDDDIKAIVTYLMDAVGASGGSSGGSTTVSDNSASGGASGNQLVTKGKDLFSKNCAACHGDTRDKMPTAKLTDKAWMDQKGQDGITQSIANGKGGMPAWKGKLSDDDIKAVVAYLFDAVGSGGASSSAASSASSGAPPASSSSPSSPSTTAATPTDPTPGYSGPGKDLFVNNCSGCHGIDGLAQKNAPIGRKSFVNGISQESLFSRIANGKTTAGMPAWSSSKGGPLSNADITAIIQYLKVLAK